MMTCETTVAANRMRHAEMQRRAERGQLAQQLMPEQRTLPAIRLAFLMQAWRAMGRRPMLAAAGTES